MSGGGGAPTAPSLAPQIGQANQTFGTATGNAAQTMNTATAYNQNAQKNLTGVTSGINSAAGAVANTANQNLQNYGSTFIPLQQQEAQAAANYGSSANVARLQGQAVSNANQANQAALANSRAALASEGVDPSSVHGAALNNQAAVAGAANVAGAGTQSAINTQQTAFGMENTANQLGLNVGAQGTAGNEGAAQTLATGQGVNNQTNATGVQNLTAANQYLNTGINATNAATNATQAQFQDQEAAFQAQQAQSAGTGQIIGDIAGIAGMAMLESGGPVPTGAGIPAVPMPGRMPRTRMAIPLHGMGGGGSVTPHGAFRHSPIPGSTDTKPALLTPGEYVIPKDVAQMKGHEFFHKLVDSTRKNEMKRQGIPVAA